MVFPYYYTVGNVDSKLLLSLSLSIPHTQMHKQPHIFVPPFCVILCFSETLGLSASNHGDLGEGGLSCGLDIKGPVVDSFWPNQSFQRWENL